MKKNLYTVTMEIEAQSEEAVSGMLDKIIMDERTLSFEILPEETEKQVRIRYDEENDSFNLEISTNGGKTWGLSQSAKCRCCGEEPNGDPSFVHFSIITKMKEAVNIGYRFVSA